MNAAAWEGVKSWLDAGLGFLYPPICQICGEGRAAADGGHVCARCWSEDGGPHFVEPPFCERCGLPHEGEITTVYTCANCRDMDLCFTAARAAIEARGVAMELIHRYKYKHALWFEPFLAGLLVRCAVPVLHNGPWNLVVPVPLHPVKEREREFNQARRLASHLARASGLRLDPSALRRTEATRTQTALSREERARNVGRAFSVPSLPAVEGAHVVLVDDVMTTGATANACASVLVRSGAASVCVWTVARAVFSPTLSSDPL
jgi:ComF family protein